MQNIIWSHNSMQKHLSEIKEGPSESVYHKSCWTGVHKTYNKSLPSHQTCKEIYRKMIQRWDNYNGSLQHKLVWLCLWGQVEGFFWFKKWCLGYLLRKGTIPADTYLHRYDGGAFPYVKGGFLFFHCWWSQYLTLFFLCLMLLLSHGVWTMGNNYYL